MTSSIPEPQRSVWRPSLESFAGSLARPAKLFGPSRKCCFAGPANPVSPHLPMQHNARVAQTGLQNNFGWASRTNRPQTTQTSGV